MEIQAISGFGDKSPACFLVTIQGKRLLLDLGEGPEPGKFPDLSGIGPVDAVLISHGHRDHVGGLKLLDRIGAPPVYTTAMVRNLGKLAARELPLRGDIEIAGIPVETGRASHAPGGIWLRLGGETGVIYTGDWTRESPLYDLDPMPRAGFMICDASYGAYDQPLAVGVAQILNEAAQAPLLLPMPPAGRGLDAALLLAEAGCEIALCPAHRRVAESLIASQAGEVSDSARTRLAAMLARAMLLHDDSRPRGVMLAGSADASEGPAAILARRFADDGAAQIILTGYVAPGTLGKSLIDQDKARFIRWNVHPRASDVAWAVAQVRPHAVLPVFAGLAANADLARAYPEIPFVSASHQVSTTPD